MLLFATRRLLIGLSTAFVGQNNPAAAYGGLPERKGRIARTCNGSMDPACAPAPNSKTLDDILEEVALTQKPPSVSKKRRPENGPMTFHDGTEERLIRRVLARSVSGDPSSVLSAVDDFCWNEHWMMNIGPEKGAFVDAAIQRAQPCRVVVELGTYVGYSTVRWAAQLDPAVGARLYSIDPERAAQESASILLAKAGLTDRVTLMNGRAEDVIPTLARRLGGLPIDVLFIDHVKGSYLADLRRIERAGLLREGSIVCADNVVAFDIADYLDHVRNSGLYSSTTTLKANLEYDGRGAKAQADGVEVSVFRGAGGVSESTFT